MSEEAIRFALQWRFGFEAVVLVYFLALNGIYLFLTVLAVISFTRYFRRSDVVENNDVFANPFSPSVTVIVSALNEELCIEETTRALLGLHYPEFEVLIIDDGSTDTTFALLRNTYGLVPSDRMPLSCDISIEGPVNAVWVSPEYPQLCVIQKRNARARADALNVGIQYARNDLICISDADSLFDPDALLRVARPFADDPSRVVAAGGIVRPSNGCIVEKGTLASAQMPSGFLAKIQVIEYLRSFMIGRTGWNVLKSSLLISGAFGIYRRDLLLELGGFDSRSLAEDAEMIFRIHRHFRTGPGTCGAQEQLQHLPSISTRKDYRIEFVTEPVCWTEVPVTARVLGRQRRRWSRGLAEVLWKYKHMIGNPRYGRIGMFALPYYVIFELFGPIIELLGVITLGVFLLLWGIGSVLDHPNAFLDLQHAQLLLLVAMGYGALLSLAALLAEELSFHRMQRWRDLAWSLLAALGENFGYRQLHSWWRLQGLIQWIEGREAEWGIMTRVGHRIYDHQERKLL